MPGWQDDAGMKPKLSKEATASEVIYWPQNISPFPHKPVDEREQSLQRDKRQSTETLSPHAPTSIFLRSIHGINLDAD